MGSCGIAAGASAIESYLNKIKEHFKCDFNIKHVGCMGMCHQEPMIEVIERSQSSCPSPLAGEGDACRSGRHGRGGRRTLYGSVDLVTVKKIVAEHVGAGNVLTDKIIPLEENAFLKKQKHIVLENCGRIDPEKIEEYEAVHGYEALKKVLKDMTQDVVIDEVIKSGLRGRGGGGFPTGLKWSFTKKATADEKYIICNADEGDPGAFMDRSVLESDPHRVIEGMIIASFAIGATHGYIYCRAEYPLAVKRLNKAIEQAISKGYLGKNILGSSHSFEIKVKEGAGAFVCGEETALIGSIEGDRGMPKIRPPFPAHKGLFGKPTNINNVETFANVPWIIRHGAQAYAKMGTEKSKGSKVFALAGDIKNGGLVEVPMGMSLNEVVNDVGGGTSSGRPVKAVQLGGPSGGCIPARLMDTIVDYDAVTATGAIMGSGGMVVMDESNCMVDIAKFFLNFTQNESCGKCTFCRIGTRRMLEILERITDGKGKDGDIELLEELAVRIKDASLCGLGQTAPNPVLTTIKYFRDEYETHIKNKKCPAGKCRALISYVVIPEKCIGCTACKRVCPYDAVEGEVKKVHKILDDKCTRCGACYKACPVEAIKRD
ncbi:MAG: NADH-quinone oxidoreductase subunit NuoF [Pseudomonadota bacterium]